MRAPQSVTRAALIAGLNHFPLSANGMRNCAGFPGVLHPYLFRLVTDALPWKPALGEKKTSPVQWEVEGFGLQSGAYNLCQRAEFPAAADVRSPKSQTGEPHRGSNALEPSFFFL